MGRVTGEGAGEMGDSKALITLYVLTQVVETQVIVTLFTAHTYLYCSVCAMPAITNHPC